MDMRPDPPRSNPSLWPRRITSSPLPRFEDWVAHRSLDVDDSVGSVSPAMSTMEMPRSPMMNLAFSPTAFPKLDEAMIAFNLADAGSGPPAAGDENAVESGGFDDSSVGIEEEEMDVFDCDIDNLGLDLPLLDTSPDLPVGVQNCDAPLGISVLDSAEGFLPRLWGNTDCSILPSRSDWMDDFMNTFPGGTAALLPPVFPTSVSTSASTSASASASAYSPSSSLTLAIESTSQPNGIVRRRSSKRNRAGSRRSGSYPICPCVLPDRTKAGQTIWLDKLPTEILLLIFEHSALSPPTAKPLCQHRVKTPGITRRRTTENHSLPFPVSVASSSSAAATTDEKKDTKENVYDPLELPTALRKACAKTLFNLNLTCRRFYQIISEDPGTDTKLWRAAALACWRLPGKLSEVQGAQASSQTSWRNLVACFMRPTNGKPVDSFGGKRPGILATTWTEYKQRHLDTNKPGKELLLVIAQPGPDLFTAHPTPSHLGGGWVLSLPLRAQHLLVHIAANGHFSPTSLSPVLTRPVRTPAHFAPDLFLDRTDRNRIVRAPLGFSTAFWDLITIPDFVADPKAAVARAVSEGEKLLCTLYTERDPAAVALGAEPPEDNTLFCLSSSSSSSPSTELLWQRTFAHPAPDEHPASLHYVFCSLALAAHAAVALVRWNTSSSTSLASLISREFHILCPSTGTTLRVCTFPNLYWDFRHHDMSTEYITTRHQKLSKMYDGSEMSVGAGRRATRVHADGFAVGKEWILGGSHDYAHWAWPCPPRAELGTGGVWDVDRNDAGKEGVDPVHVLDDYYWDGNSTEGTSQGELDGKWATHNERAGWWVETPNQIMCYWHAVALSPCERYYASARPGRLFLWDLQKPAGVEGSVRGYRTPGDSDGEWMGQLRNPRLKERLSSWFVYKGAIPRQGLWMVFDDGEAVFLNREELLEVCGGGEWEFGNEDFGNGEEQEEVGEGAVVGESEGGVKEVDEGEYAVDVGEDEDEEEEEEERRKRRRTMEVNPEDVEEAMLVWDLIGVVDTPAAIT